MIVATPLDLPIIKPDNWDTFWDIWNTHSANLVKVLNNTTKNSQVGATNIWKGLDIFAKGTFKTAWNAPLVDISSSLPNLYNVCATLPIENVCRVRLISSLESFNSHTDDNIDKWSIRAYFHYTDVNDQWYFTNPNDAQGHRYYFHVPKETNWFAYNDKHCWHGTDFDPRHPKILLQIFSFGNNSALINNSIEKYKQYTIDLND
jgi:hypothetical protein